MIYTFNLMVGVEPNGVDVAQAHRAKVFRQLKQDARFVFTQIPPREKLDYFLDLGYQEEEILLAHMLLTDQRDISLGLSVTDFVEVLDLKAEPYDKDMEVHFDEASGVSLVLVRNRRQPEFVHCVDYYVDGFLVKREHYGKTKLYTEFFTMVHLDIGLVARVCRRLYHNQDGSVAYEELMESQDLNADSNFRQGPDWFYGRVAHMERVLAELDLGSEDMVIMDRFIELPFTQVLLKMKGQARVVGVIHSEHHYGQRLNPEYHYLFQNRRAFDHIVVGTQQQRDRILEDYDLADKLVVLSAGALQGLWQKGNRKPHSVMAVARFERRKRLDLTIAAVAAYHKINPQVRLDIYGKGHLHADLEEQIKRLGAEGYISLKGHQDLTRTYAHYELYLATSEWETFGLTLMEAVGSGLAMVGLDAPYGNQTFIQDGLNGYRVPFGNRTDQEMVSDLSQALDKAFGQIPRLREGSYQVAVNYMEEELVKRWRDFLSQSNEQ